MVLNKSPTEYNLNSYMTITATILKARYVYYPWLSYNAYYEEKNKN
jgi:hypothetical protein